MYTGLITRQLRVSRSHFVSSSIPCISSTYSPFSTSTASMFALSTFRGNPADQPKTFSRQGELPRLPIPTLEDTFTRYIASLEPILLQADEQGRLDMRQTAATELQRRRTWAEQAAKEGTLVQKLQQRLIDVDRTTPNNWLDDRFWPQKAYHEWRVPLLVNSNWWLLMRADPNTPAAQLEDPSAEVTKGDVSSDSIGEALGANDWIDAEWGIRRATWLVYRLLLFKHRLDTEDIMPDASRAGAFCMHQYSKVFGITRIPAIPHDYNTATPHPTKARHLTVMARNNIYELCVLQENGSIVPLQEIEVALKAIVADARKGDGKSVGILTADGRDEWTRARERLLSISQQNRQTINSIEDSLFSLCLDSSVLPLPIGHPDIAHHCTPASVDAHARNGSGAGRMGTNRWFDKAVTIVVEPNGRASLMGEHSPCDALIPSIVAEFALAEPSPPPSEPLPSGTMKGVSNTASSSSSSAPLYRKLDWDVDSKIEANIKSAFSVAKGISRESDIGVLWFDDFGTTWIKKVAKQSPDAFLQQVLQLAFHKVKGYQVPTYETASTRLFRHGRTDVIRSFSTESYELIKAVRQGKPGSEVYKLLSQATTAHNAQTKASSTGKGVDRHLTGLRLVYDAHEDGALPAEGSAAASSGFWAGAKLLFGDELLGESQGWKLSTSGLSAGDKLAGTGFGSGYLDGYGINYLAGANLLKFGIESKHPPPDGQGESGEDPTHQLSTAIVESLQYLKHICEKEAPATSEGSKL